MLVNFSAKMRNMKKEVLKRGDADLTLGDVSVDALMLADAAEKKEPAKTKCERYKLACRITDATEPIEITPEEATLIREKINDGFGPLIVGQVYEIIK